MTIIIPQDRHLLPPVPPDPFALKLPTAGVRPKITPATTTMPSIDPAMPVSVWTRTCLGFDPDPVQAEILDTYTHRLIVCCSRQWGKTTIAAAKAVHLAWTQPGSLILFTSASFKQAAELLRKFRYFVQLLTGQDFKGDGVHRGSTILPNGSRILALPQSPVTVRGYSAPALVVIDEAAFVTDAMHDALSPILAASNGQLWMISSPNAQTGEFHDIWTTRPANWRRFRVTAEECSRISPEFLASERLVKGDSIFRREYLCEFVAGPKQVIERALIDRAFQSIHNAIDLE